MTPNITGIRIHIQNFTFDDLFIDELGWDQYHDQLEVVVENDTITLNGFAEKRGMVAFMVKYIPENKIRRKIEQQVAKSHRENMIIYVDDEQTRQIWQWVRREPGKPLANRERKFQDGQSGQAIAEILATSAFSLDEEDGLTIVDVTSRVRAAFDVEKVTKKFYNRFKKQHDAFLKFIEGIPDSDFKRWYASVVLNRVMFIYFVQRKGFIDGDQDYLRNRLAKSDGNFYRNFLIPLFFEGFAKKKHSSDIKQLLGDVPYLNGGLFLPHQVEEHYGNDISISDDAFKKLFDFFDEYQWHLDENPLRNDNEINPDVLGYIFEKYINQKQMGAYYTKEDITEYISKNTVIPFLFDEAHKAVKIAFKGEHTVWDLLVENPDRYIYPVVQHGTHLELPDEIAVGIDDVNQRDQWNIPAPPNYGLPTEIWRETVARYQRYYDIRGQLERGEIRQINDLITLNLDMQQFAQDVLAFTDSPDVIRAFWKSLNSVTVLDPTCGSGAFLFAALNILEPMYEACVERMEGFLSELDEQSHAQKYSDFREVIARIDQHPNRRYFILKSIIIQNLYGVDIMEEAIEIAKLRLFLKLMAQVDDKHKIEPLPDIDFNIRAGNTLVGFATQDEVRQALTKTSSGQGKLLFGEDNEALEEIESKAQEIDQLFGAFRKQQTEIGGEASPEDKVKLKYQLAELEAELNHLLARQYGVDPSKESQYNKWRKSHKPFHWFTEFYGVLKTGGFDVIIGNPPYVEYSKVKKEYTILGYKTEKAGNLYAHVIERCTKILQSNNGQNGVIIPTSSISTGRMIHLQDFISNNYEHVYLSNYDATSHPGILFIGVQFQLTILLMQTGDLPIKLQSTVAHRWYSLERYMLFVNITYASTSVLSEFTTIPKIGTNIEKQILPKILANGNCKPLNNFIVSKKVVGNEVYYRNAGNVYYRLFLTQLPMFTIDGKQKKSSTMKSIKVNLSSSYIAAILSSNIFYWWWSKVSDIYHVVSRDIHQFPIPILDVETQKELSEIYSIYLHDIFSKSSTREYRYPTGLAVYQELYPRNSKILQDEIDRFLAKHYGFTDEELDFIINYDIKYRMGSELFDGDGDA